MKVIVFALNGCPASWLGAYGNDWVGTPHLDRLAAESVTFDQHISDCPAPTAARLAWRWTERISGNSFLIRANHPDTDADNWYYDGWSEVFDVRPQAKDSSPLDQLLRLFSAILNRLKNVPDYLLWIETDRLIPPWNVQQDVFNAYLEGEESEIKDAVPPFAAPPTGPFDRTDLDAWDWLRNTFAAVITKLDAELGILFTHLCELGLDQSAAWLVTSNFGYPLGEHGQIGLHRPWLHEELVHLPLFMRLPGAEQAGRRIATFTQPPDIHATLQVLLGNTPTVTNGFNLLPLARGEVKSVRSFARTKLSLGDAAETSIRTYDSALLVPTKVPVGDPPREPLLYEKPDDRYEVNNIYKSNIERADQLQTKHGG